MLRNTRVITVIANINPVIGANMVGRKEGIEIGNTHYFILNAAFIENSKEYATRPVRAGVWRFEGLLFGEIGNRRM